MQGMAFFLQELDLILKGAVTPTVFRYVPSDLWLTALFSDTHITVSAPDCRGVYSSCYGKIVWVFFPGRFPPLTCRVVKEKLC